MAKMGNGYGSEAHLLRFMGRHRNRLDALVLEATGATSIRWLDFTFNSAGRWQDSELQGLTFTEDPELLAKWGAFWPTTGRQPTWDAVAKLEFPAGMEWLLVEAKANIEEIERETGAGEPSRRKIESAFRRVQEDLGIAGAPNWLKGFYQYAFQVSTLWFLNHNTKPTRLLYIYFVGDRNPSATCPKSELEWLPAIRRMHEHVAVPTEHAIEDRIHTVFIPVSND